LNLGTFHQSAAAAATAAAAAAAAVEFKYTAGDWLLFGAETTGLPLQGMRPSGAPRHQQAPGFTDSRLLLLQGVQLQNFYLYVAANESALVMVWLSIAARVCTRLAAARFSCVMCLEIKLSGHWRACLYYTPFL
jgi:hypothetical protein